MAEDLSVVIVSWNTRDRLRACLQALPAAAEGLTCGILVADNASADGTPAMVRDDFPRVQLLETGANVGFGRACNLGAEAIGGRRLAFLNPDTVCPPGSLTSLCDHLDRIDDAVAVGPALVDRHERETACWGDLPAPWHHWRELVDPAHAWLPRRWRDPGLGRTAESARRTPRHRDPATGALAVPYVKGACLVTGRATWERVGPFDERFFMYFEETDWCRRACQDGGRVYLCPDVRVRHDEGVAAGQVSRFSLRQLQHSYRLYLAKHEGPTAVARTRRAQLWQYRWKTLLQRLTRGPRTGEYALLAALQHEDDLTPTPPTRAEA
ncbi:glycosyltransferase [bacterium]|nr:glycosyltransferase [bacterium]